MPEEVDRWVFPSYENRPPDQYFGALDLLAVIDRNIKQPVGKERTIADTNPLHWYSYAVGGGYMLRLLGAIPADQLSVGTDAAGQTSLDVAEGYEVAGIPDEPIQILIDEPEQRSKLAFWNTLQRRVRKLSVARVSGNLAAEMAMESIEIRSFKPPKRNLWSFPKFDLVEGVSTKPLSPGLKMAIEEKIPKVGGRVYRGYRYGNITVPLDPKAKVWKQWMLNFDYHGGRKSVPIMDPTLQILISSGEYANIFNAYSRFDAGNLLYRYVQNLAAVHNGDDGVLREHLKTGVEESTRMGRDIKHHYSLLGAGILADIASIQEEQIILASSFVGSARLYGARILLNGPISMNPKRKYPIVDFDRSQLL